MTARRAREAEARMKHLGRVVVVVAVAVAVAADAP